MRENLLVIELRKHLIALMESNGILSVPIDSSNKEAA